MPNVFPTDLLARLVAHRGGSRLQALARERREAESRVTASELVAQAEPESKAAKRERRKGRALLRLVELSFPGVDDDRRRDIIVDIVAVMQRHQNTLPE